MSKQRYSDAIYLLAFFLMIISIGTVLLSLPISWSREKPLAFIDAAFIATSAVCVTGLSTVDTADFSRFGQIVILLLIQIGGLGIISFTSLLLVIPGRRLPFRRLATIRGFSIHGIEHDHIKIVRNIILFTFIIESIGALALYFAFSAAGTPEPVFIAVFHSISAFCNAGFSPFRDSLEGFRRNPALLGIISALIVTGGLGFIVLIDIGRRMRGQRKKLSFHSKAVLTTTAILILGGTTAFWVFEGDGAFSDMNTADRCINALFQAITPRTAGFNAVPQSGLSQPSKFIVMLFMFVGGAPGSIAGGIKITTAILVLLVMMRRPDEFGDINICRRRMDAKTLNAAIVYFLKAVFLLLLSAGALSITEGLHGADFSRIVFESMSAFGTVGLSLGLTGTLSHGGKLVIIATMFAGRVGLVALAFPGEGREKGEQTYPAADILLG